MHGLGLDRCRFTPPPDCGVAWRHRRTSSSRVMGLGGVFTNVLAAPNAWPTEVLAPLFVCAGTEWLVPKSPVAFHSLGLLPVCIPFHSSRSLGIRAIVFCSAQKEWAGIDPPRSRVPPCEQLRCLFRGLLIGMVEASLECCCACVLGLHTCLTLVHLALDVGSYLFKPTIHLLITLCALGVRDALSHQCWPSRFGPPHPRRYCGPSRVSSLPRLTRSVVAHPSLCRSLFGCGLNHHAPHHRIRSSRFLR